MSTKQADGLVARQEKHGQVILAARVSRGWSQERFAEVLRLAGLPRFSQATVWSVEKGRRPLRFTEAITIAQVFGYPDVEAMFKETPA